MIVVYEPFCIGLNHVPINSDFLIIIAEHFSDDEIVFIADNNHIKNVKEKMGDKSHLITCHSIEIIDPSKGKIKSILNERKNMIQIAKKFGNKMRLFFLLNSHPHSMYFAKKHIPESIPIIFLLHGNLEELKRKKKIYQLGYWIKPVFRYKSSRKNVKFIVLGDSIRENVLKYCPFLSESLIAVPHPYSMYERVQPIKSDRSKIVFGMIGSFSPEKRSELIFSLEEQVREHNISNVEFLLVGADDHNGFLHNEHVKILGDGNKKLSNDDYNSGIEQLDFVLFFWPSDSYTMTASGAVHDAIAHNKPIISIRNSYLTWVFDKIGDVGFLCENFDELVNIVIQISTGKLNDKLAAFYKNYENAESFFSRENVSNIMNNNKVWMI